MLVALGWVLSVGLIVLVYFLIVLVRYLDDFVFDFKFGFGVVK